MKKKLLPIVTVVALLTMPVSQAMAAPKPTPPGGSQMDMTASQMASGQPAMSGWDMVKMRTTAKMRAKAARNARLKGKPAQAVAASTFVAAKGPDYFGNTPNYASSNMPHVTWKAGGGNVTLPIFDPTIVPAPPTVPSAVDLGKQLIDPSIPEFLTDGTANPAYPTYIAVGSQASPGAGNPYQVDATGRIVMDPINQVAQLDLTRVNVTGGIRKFVEPLPGVGAPSAGSTMKNLDAAQGNQVASYIPVATADTTTYPGSDYYVIGLKDYYQTFSPDLPPTHLRGYYQKNAPTPAEARPYYLGPIIVARAGVPVRVKFVNELPTGTGGDLFIPTDTTAMGAGAGPDGTYYTQNRAVIHLHGGLTPWISDGTPHQWTTPVGDRATYPKGVSVTSVPDMPAVQTVNSDGTKKTGAGNSDGTLTFFYTNKQSARMMWYHDHAYGLTRLNVYVGEVAGYLLKDSYSDNLVTTGVVPGAGTPANEGIPLIIQDKAFVPENTPSGYFPDGQLTTQDPTWLPKWGGTGNLWFPHVYMPNQNPYDQSGAAPMGRWDYGPWFWPIFGTAAGLVHGEVNNPYFDPTNAPWEPPMIPGTPSTYTKAQGLATSDASLVPEGFVDTPVVNGVAYPYMTVDAKAYRFRILNGANDRYWNLQMYCSAADIPAASGMYTATNTADMWNGATLVNAAAGEVPMVPAVRTPGFPADWPTDGRAGGVPNPFASAGNFVQIGTESGVLANAAEVANQPVNYVYNRRDIIVLSISTHALLLGPAERADVVYDFAAAANKGCKNVILYNDAPTPVPAFDPRNDYYTNNGDQTSSGGTPSTLPGYGPNTRTIMQFRINGATGGGTPIAPAATAFDMAKLKAAVPTWFASTQHKPIVPEVRYHAAYPTDPIGDANVYSNIGDNKMSFNTSTVGDVAALNLNPGSSGYAPTVTATGGGGAGAVLVPVIGTNGQVASVTVVSPGAGYRSSPTLTISQPVGGQAATLQASVRRGVITGVTVLTGGSLYSSGATVTVAAPPTGNTAYGTATVDQTTGAVSALTITDVGNGYAAAPVVTISAPLYVNGVQATATSTLATSVTPVTLKMEPKAIQELFEMDYGRMNATLGVELPFTNAGTQTTLPLGYAEPTSEFMKPSDGASQVGTTRNGTEIWKITHNGVDTHTIHFHLSDIQLINRVGWDGAIRPPDDNEIGWKESVRMNPLEDAIVAMRPEMPELPFKIGDSVRSIDPSMPQNHQMTTLDPLTGVAVTFPNTPVSFGWEYVWHCHLLGHEENDMMRPVDFKGSPDAPTIGAAVAGPNGGATGTVTVNWTNNANWQLTNFVVQRADDANFTTGVVKTLSDKAPLTGGSYQNWQGGNTTLGIVNGKSTSFVDALNDPATQSGKTYYYRVRAEGAQGYSAWSDSVRVTAPTFSVPTPPPAAPTGVRITSLTRSFGQPAFTVSFSGLNTTANAGVSFVVRYSTSSAFPTASTYPVTVNGNTNGAYQGRVRNGAGTPLASGTTYYVQVQTQLNGQASAWTPAAPLTAVPQ